MAINYVRFQRGTLAAYQALLEKDLISDNTLYFIYADNDASIGSLYMGKKLISNGEVNQTVEVLNDLSDVNVANAEINSFLVKDDATGKWVAKSPAQVAELIQDHISIDNEITFDFNGDNLSVEIIDNIIQLKNYGTNYYAFVPAVKDETGNIIEKSKYVLTEGFKAGLEPRVEETSDGLIISWYEPNTEAIDDLNDEIDKIESSLAETQTSLSDLNNILNAENGIVNQVNNLVQTVGYPTDSSTSATGLYKEIEDLEAAINTKADVSNVYTKEDTNKLITSAISGADHLRRKIVNNLDDIDITADDAHLYIYMVPTGLQYEDDKYDEYVVIDNIIEKVGSWEIDLSQYAKTTDVNNALENKVDVVEGSRLITSDEAKKLSALVVEDDGSVAISGTVGAGKVQELYDNVVRIVTGAGTAEYDGEQKNLLDIAPGAEVNVIQTVNLNDFTLDATTRTLNLNDIAIDKVTNLTNVLAKKVDVDSLNSNHFTVSDGIISLKESYVTTTLYQAEVGDLAQLMHSALLEDGSINEDSTLVDEINYINERLTWIDMNI